jgi:hypothetical protein
MKRAFGIVLAVFLVALIVYAVIRLVEWAF